MITALPLILALQTAAPGLTPLQEAEANYEFEQVRATELCEALGRLSVATQTTARAGEETASLLERANGQVAKINGASGGDQRALGLTEGVLTMNVNRQRQQVEALQSAVETAAGKSREFCGA